MTDETDRSGFTIIGNHIEVRWLDPVECVEIDGHSVPMDGTPYTFDEKAYVPTGLLRGRLIRSRMT